MQAGAQGAAGLGANGTWSFLTCCEPHESRNRKEWAK